MFASEAGASAMGSVAIVVLQVWKYSSAIAHLNVCLEIAAGAAAEKKRFSLAIIYDEICRSEWNLKATRGPKLFADAVVTAMCKAPLCLQVTGTST